MATKKVKSTVTSNSLHRVMEWFEKQPEYDKDLWKNTAKVNRLVREIAKNVGKKKNKGGNFSISNTDISKISGLDLSKIFPKKTLPSKFRPDIFLIPNIKEYLKSYVYNPHPTQTPYKWGEVTFEWDEFDIKKAVYNDLQINVKWSYDSFDENGEPNGGMQHEWFLAIDIDGMGSRGTTLLDLTNADNEALSKSFINELVFEIQSSGYTLDMTWYEVMDLRIIQALFDKGYFEDMDIDTKIKIVELSGLDKIFPKDVQEMFIF